MARCSDCNRFVSYGESEIEVDTEIVDDDGVITANVEIMLTCADCGTPIKSASLEADAQLEHECDGDVEGDRYEIVKVSSSPTDRQVTSRNVKPLNRRAWRSFYGAEIEFKVHCNVCGADLSASASVEEQASVFEEI